MTLSDRDIKKAVELGDININPFHVEHVQPASLDVILGNRFFFPSEDTTRELTNYDVAPGEFLLASTVETITLGPSMAARFEGKSSWGRLGLLTHCTAGFIDPGFTGQITLELVNLSKEPVHLEAGMLIGQISFSRLSSSCDHQYGSNGLGSHYQWQRGPTPASPQ